MESIELSAYTRRWWPAEEKRKGSESQGTVYAEAWSSERQTHAETASVWVRRMGLQMRLMEKEETLQGPHQVVS